MSWRVEVDEDEDIEPEPEPAKPARRSRRGTAPRQEGSRNRHRRAGHSAPVPPRRQVRRGKRLAPLTSSSLADAPGPYRRARRVSV